MTMGRYVLLLLASPDATWLSGLRQRLTAADLIFCAEPEEACVRLRSGRLHSALVVDAATELDFDVATAADLAGTPVIPVRPGDEDVDLRLVRPIPWGDRLPAPVATLLGAAEELPAWQGRLVGVCGPGGTGVSVVAMALAEGLAGRGDLLLADFALRADQALLHGLSDSPVGLVEVIRRGLSSPCELRAATLAIPGRRYQLLPGLSRPHHWVAVRPRAFDVALAALRSAFGLVVADITADFEGDADTGSIEVEERNHMARRVAGSADLIVVVGGTGLTARHATAELVEGLRALGVDQERILAVANRVATDRDQRWALPEVALDGDDGLPVSAVTPLVEAVTATLRRVPRRDRAVLSPPVVPGTLGRWEGAE
jgi:MinD-like ATPase involved in chromosome partitioning or flagellar assembly